MSLRQFRLIGAAAALFLVFDGKIFDRLRLRLRLPVADSHHMNLLSRLPKGAQLTQESWEQRHRILTWILWIHVPALVAIGLLGPIQGMIAAATKAAEEITSSLDRLAAATSTL